MEAQHPEKSAKRPRRKMTWVVLVAELFGLGGGGAGGAWALLDARTRNQEVATLRAEVASLREEAKKADACSARVESLEKDTADRKRHEEISAEISKEIERMWRGKRP